MTPNKTKRWIEGAVTPEEELNDSLWEAFSAHTHEHRIIQSIPTRTRQPSIITMEIYSDPDEFKSQPIYQEFYKYLSIENQISVVTPTSDGYGTTLTFARDAAFKQSETTMARLLMPHFVSAWQTWSTLQAAGHQRHNELAALDQSGTWVLHVSKDGKLINGEDSAWPTLERHFSTAGRPRGFLPDNIRRWITKESDDLAQAVGHRPQLLKVRSSHGELLLRLVPCSSPDHFMLVAQETPRPANPKDLEQLGLTTAQARVLHAVSRGLTNKDVGQELGIKPSTVRTHLEQIYSRLGVRTRTEAAAKAATVPRHDTTPNRTKG